MKHCFTRAPNKDQRTDIRFSNYFLFLIVKRIKIKKKYQKQPIVDVLRNRWLYNFIKKELQHRYFPVKLAKFLRTEHHWWLLLKYNEFDA